MARWRLAQFAIEAREYSRKGCSRGPQRKTSLPKTLEIAGGEGQSVVLFGTRIVLPQSEIRRVAPVLGVIFRKPVRERVVSPWAGQSLSQVPC